MKLQIAFALLFATAYSSGLAASTSTFFSGISVPTGLALHPLESKLYVNSGASGRVWSIDIDRFGNAGTITTLTESFQPDSQVVFDAAGNLFGSYTSSNEVCRLGADSSVACSDTSRFLSLSPAIAVESPRIPSSTVFLSQEDNYLTTFQLGHWSAGSRFDTEMETTCDTFRYFLYRRSTAGLIGTQGGSVISINPVDGSCTTLLSGLVLPNGLAEDNSGNLYVADSGTGQIVKISPLGMTSTVASHLDTPLALAYDSVFHRLFVSEPSENRILVVELLAPGTGIGLYNPARSIFYLRSSASAGAADDTFTYGPAGLGWTPLVGDWDGDGADTIGLYNPTRGMFYLRNANSNGIANATFIYGPSGRGWQPLTGDWNGDGNDTIGLYDPAAGRFYLRYTNDSGIADVSFRYGPNGLGWLALTGDWDGNGTDTIGLYDPLNGRFYLRNSNSQGIADAAFVYGPANLGWTPLVGDWDGDSTDTIGLYNADAGRYYLRNSNSNGIADVNARYGPAPSSWMPLSGAWGN